MASAAWKAWRSTYNKQEKARCKPGLKFREMILFHLGRIDYATGLALQKTLVELRHQQRIGNVLLLLEHPPVLTLGRNSSRQNILASDELLSARGVEVHEINRGGDVTYHGPGQLVGYPIFDLRSFSPRLGAVDYVRKLEEVLIRACGDYGIPTHRMAGRTGVWTAPVGAKEDCRHRRAHLAWHYLAWLCLEMTTDLRDFNLIVPCGIADRDVTSLELETSRTIQLEPAANAMPVTLDTALETRYFAGFRFIKILSRLESLEDLLPDPAESPAQDTPLTIPRELKQLQDVKESHFERKLNRLAKHK